MAGTGIRFSRIASITLYCMFITSNLGVIGIEDPKRGFPETQFTSVLPLIHYLMVQSLENWVQQQDNIVDTLRAQGGYLENNFPRVPNEQTNWIDEIRATVETCALADLSHHMTAVHLKGDDTIELLKNLCVNNFDNFEIGQAKQIIMCNHEGHIMGDGPLLRLDDNEFYGPGIHATKWLQYNLETNEYDVTAEIEPPTPSLSGDPESFVYQVQGPHAYDVLHKLTDDNVEDVGFYRFKTISLAGREIRAFGHGMSTESGLELHGPYEYAQEIRDAIVEAGKEYDLREIGTKVYNSPSVRLGWVAPFIKPVYGIEEMEEYRKWATPEKEKAYGKHWGSEQTLESSFSIEGSFDSDNIRDYYMTPVELGYAKLINFDHDFIGKAALKEEVDNPQRKLVSLMWDEDDVCRVNNSIFRDGDNHKYIDSLPRLGWARQPYDTVLKDGNVVGISRTRSYEWDVRGIVSLCTIDTEFSEPGTTVNVVWGEPNGDSPNPNIEDHVPTEIEAVVRSTPYSTDKRKKS